MLWRREPYPRHDVASTARRKEERLAGHQRPVLHIVELGYLIDNPTGVIGGTQASGQIPQRVPRSHDVLDGPWFAPGSPRCPRQRGDAEQRCHHQQDRGGGTPTANACSMHESMMCERMFDVNRQVERMFEPLCPA